MLHWEVEQCLSYSVQLDCLILGCIIIYLYTCTVFLVMMRLRVCTSIVPEYK